VFESIVYKNLIHLLKNIIIEDQYGFIFSRYSTFNFLFSILIFLQYVLYAFSARYQVEIYINIDFSEAFDKIRP